MGEWTTSAERPGYRSKTIKRGAATIVIHRPIETPAKAEQQARTAMESALRSYYARRPGA